jgi:Holliday junction resolvase
MVSFKLAAIKILRESNKPLHYEKITEFALEKNLIETSGATPEATMNAQISVDIKANGSKSAFIRVKPGFFSLNPKYTPKEEKAAEKQEKIQEEQDKKEEISSQYIGKYGEHLVVSELLLRGYNASIMTVDEGIDIVATRDERLYNIQVKTSRENKFKSYVFDIRISSFEKFNKNNVYYIFVLKGKKTNFVILPFFEIQKNIDQNNILVVGKETRYRVNIKIRDEKLYLGNKGNDMSYFMNKWEMIK